MAKCNSEILKIERYPFLAKIYWYSFGQRNPLNSTTTSSRWNFSKCTLILAFNYLLYRLETSEHPLGLVLINKCGLRTLMRAICTQFILSCSTQQESELTRNCYSISRRLIDLLDNHSVFNYRLVTFSDQYRVPLKHSNKDNDNDSNLQHLPNIDAKHRENLLRYRIYNQL